VAWVAVEREERDAQRFWLSVVGALSGAAGAAGLVDRVSPSPVFRGDVVLDRLLSELESPDRPIVLVIDDLHELRSPEAEAWLELFVARLPPRLTLVLATREEPRLGAPSPAALGGAGGAARRRSAVLARRHARDARGGRDPAHAGRDGAPARAD
jgi:LuxR family maltose regulon positive regulatory protein